MSLVAWVFSENAETLSYLCLDYAVGEFTLWEPFGGVGVYLVYARQTYTRLGGENGVWEAVTRIRVKRVVNPFGCTAL